jgi:hypothetical protein
MMARSVEYDYSNVHMVVLGVDGDPHSISFINGGYGHQERDCNVEAKLKQGEYLFFVEVDWTKQESYKECQFCATSYGPAQV